MDKVLNERDTDFRRLLIANRSHKSNVIRNKADKTDSNDFSPT